MIVFTAPYFESVFVWDLNNSNTSVMFGSDPISKSRMQHLQDEKMNLSAAVERPHVLLYKQSHAF